jgi:hypothetical protein
MNARLNICQAVYDAKLPPPVSDTTQEVARAEWLYNAAEQLVVFSCGISFRRRMCKVQGVSMRQFQAAVDEHVNGRLADCEVGTPALGALVIAATQGGSCSVSAKELLGSSDHPLGKLGEIAESLLEPLADDALKAQAEDDEL